MGGSYVLVYKMGPYVFVYSSMYLYVIGSEKQPLLRTDVLLISGGLQRIT